VPTTKKTMAQTARSTDRVNYQEGSIVSRTRIDRETGTVTLFAFDGEQGLSEHTAPFDAFICVFDGQAEVIISSKPFELKEEEIIIMPANEPHALRAVERFKMMLTMIRS